MIFEPKWILFFSWMCTFDFNRKIIWQSKIEHTKRENYYNTKLSLKKKDYCNQLNRASNQLLPTWSFFSHSKWLDKYKTLMHTHHIQLKQIPIYKNTYKCTLIHCTTVNYTMNLLIQAFSTYVNFIWFGCFIFLHLVRRRQRSFYCSAWNVIRVAKVPNKQLNLNYDWLLNKTIYKNVRCHL